MKNKKFTICNATIQPGEEANLALPLPDYFSCAPLYMPIRVINGKQKGPCLVIFSTLNGSEFNGIEIVNRILDSVEASEISGTIIAIPVLNVYGLTHFPKTLPSPGNLERCFPGSEDGSYGERMAHLFTNEILKKADYCIELQTGDLNHNILPQVYCNFDNKTAKNLAKVFHAPVVTNVSLEENTLRQTTEELNIPLLVYEAGEALRFDENAILVGFNGVTNVMQEIKMLPQINDSDYKPIFSQNEDWITGHSGGILRTSCSLGQVISKDEVLGKIIDPFGTNATQDIQAPLDGVIVGINTTPMVHEGLPIFKIASFIDVDRAESSIEEWNKEQPDSFLD